MSPSQTRSQPPSQRGNPTQFWLVQGACRGKDLASAIADGDLQCSRLRWTLLPKLRILRDVAQGLAHMHASGLAHGALCCSCVFLEVCQLLDCTICTEKNYQSLPSLCANLCINSLSRGLWFSWPRCVIPWLRHSKALCLGQIGSTKAPNN
jgi:hypothetical protein